MLNKVMKTFIILLSIFTYFALPCSSQTKTHKEQAGLKGQVKSIEEFRTFIGMNEPRRPVRKITYNPKGNIIERILYSEKDNSIQEKFVYQYDAKGRNTGYDEYVTSYDKARIIPRKHIYTLDKNGNMTEYRVSEPDGTLAGRFTYRYDEKGKKVEYTDLTGSKTFYEYDAKGDLTYSQTSNQTRRSEIFYKYDNEGRLIIRTFHNTVLNLDQTISYVYKDKIKQESEYGDGKLRYVTTTVSDDEGRIVEEEILEFNKPKIRTTKMYPIPGKVVYKYDDEKRLKEILKYNPEGFLLMKETTFYNEKNNESKIEREYFKEVLDSKTEAKSLETSASITKIEYDSEGNWIEKKDFISSKTGNTLIITSSFERIITYF
ncbi:MAG: RHS repeat domain-containing protein [Pyrinomonadaceae bacterium]